jgi:hypothetical protein
MKDVPIPRINFSYPGAFAVWDHYMARHPGHLRSFAGRFIGRVTMIVERRARAGQPPPDARERFRQIEAAFSESQVASGRRYTILVSGWVLADLVEALGECWVHGPAVAEWYSHRSGFDCFL